MALSLDKLSQVLLAIGEPARLRLLTLCVHGELTVKELTEATGMSQPRVSRHLRILVEADVLERFRESHWVYYRLRFNAEAARLARRALASASSEDRELAADARRLDAVLAARAREARAASESDGEILSSTSWASVETAIRGMLGDVVGDEDLGNLLDIGTGAGRMLHMLAADARRAEGVDQSPEMRFAARTALREAGLANCSVRAGNMYDLPYEDGRFDTVVIGHVLTSAEEPWKAVAEAARVLRASGRLLVMELLPEGVPVEAWTQSLADWLAGVGADALAQQTLELPGVTAVIMLNERRPPAAREADLADSA